MKTYIGQRGRDKVLRLWVEHHGKRYPMRSGEVAGRILVDLFGLSLAKEDVERRCAAFDQAVLAHRIELANWTLSETEVRAWNANFLAQQERLKAGANAASNAAADAAPEPEAEGSEDAEDVGAAGQELLVAWGREATRAKILHVSPSVLLLEGDKPQGQSALKPGALVRVGRPGKAPDVPARVAADGQGGRYLLALGLRAVRGTPRVRVDLPAIVVAPGMPGPASARIADLSSSGARLRSVALPLGADCEVSFVPPGHRELVTVRSVIVHAQRHWVPPEVGIAFRGAALEFQKLAS